LVIIKNPIFSAYSNRRFWTARNVSLIYELIVYSSLNVAEIIPTEVLIVFAPVTKDILRGLILPDIGVVILKQQTTGGPLLICPFKYSVNSDTLALNASLTNTILLDGPMAMPDSPYTYTSAYDFVSKCEQKTAPATPFLASACAAFGIDDSL
jgi:hypothetical protein